MERVLLLTICLIIITFLPTNSQTQSASQPLISNERVPLSPIIAAIKRQVADSSKKAIEEFWQRVKANGTPIIEPAPDMVGYSIVTFVYRGRLGLKSVRFDSPLNALLIKGIEPNFERLGLMEQLADTDIWYLSFHVRNDLRTAYTFHPDYDTASTGNDKLRQEIKPQLDVYNRSAFARGIDQIEGSVVELSEAVPQLWCKESLGVSKGEWSTFKFNSKALGNERTIWIYKPTGYEPKRKKPYSFVVCFGGFEFGKIIQTDIILDNLIAAGKIAPTLAILIDNVDAKNEQDQYSSMIQFVGDELIPHLRKQYNLTHKASEAVIAGTSRRGLVATLTGYKRFNIFGGVLSMSGSLFWRPSEKTEYEWLSTQFSLSPPLPLKLYLTVGLLETVVSPRNMGHYMLSANRHLRNVLQAKGYKFKYEEVNSGHEDLNWQGGFANGLIFLLGH